MVRGWGESERASERASHFGALGRDGPIAVVLVARKVIKRGRMLVLTDVLFEKRAWLTA